MTTTYIVTACTSDKRWFDLDAERTAFLHPDHNEHNLKRGGPTYGTKGPNLDRGDLGAGNFHSTHAGAPPLDCWIDGDAPTVTRRLINLMCPREVCVRCGEPRRRIVGETEYVQSRHGGTPAVMDFREGEIIGGGNRSVLGVKSPKSTGGDSSVTRTAPTLGWTDCGHNSFRPGVTLDPFANCQETPMSRCQFLLGDVYARLAELPDASVDLIVTSPPFLALRSYLPADHPDKAKEIGSEPTPAAFLSTLLALTREWRRVLAPHGSIAVELGDTYSGVSVSAAGQQSTNDEYNTPGRSRYNYMQPVNVRGKGVDGWPLAKSLCLIPSLYAGSLAYGHNLLDPDDTITPWRIRNLIVWHRPNPPVGALGDKVRPSTSYITTACTSDRRWFDLDAERTDFKGPQRFIDNVYEDRKRDGANESARGGGLTVRMNTQAGAPPLDCWIDGDVWTIPTAPYKGAHYATYPIALPRRLINLMCPREVCVVCGEARRRITATTNAVQLEHLAHDRSERRENSTGVNHWKAITGATSSNVETLGWTDCECYGTLVTARNDRWRRGVVLDPFAGSGTTGVAASESGRDSILIDLDERNLHLARERIGLFLDETPPTERATP